MSRVAALWEEEWAAGDAFSDSLGAFTSSAAAPLTLTYPATLYVQRLQIALGADLSADPLTWSWLDITGRVRQIGISLSTGRRDEASTVTPGQAAIKLDNRDGAMSRRNPNSPYYGLLSKNTPIWATVDAGTGAKTRLEMFVNEWPTRWFDTLSTDSTVTIQCAGVLRRLSQGNVLHSPLRRAIIASAPKAYWPLEDGFDATGGGSAIGGPPMTVDFGEIGFDGRSDLPGALSAPDTSTGSLTGFVTGVSATAWHVELAWYGFPNTDGAMGRVYTNGSTYNVWRLFPPWTAGDDFTIFINDETGAGPSTGMASSTLATAAWGTSWHHLALTAEQVGGNIVSRMYVDGILEDTNTSAGTLGSPVKVLLNQNVSLGEYVSGWAHVHAGDGVTPSIAAAAMDGYSGEMAHDRIERLTGEEGIVFEATAATSAAMGPQTAGTLLALLRECEAADGGVLYEKRWGLAYKSLAEYYNQPVSLALDFNQGHIADLPEPADDDQRTRNRWTVSRYFGSEYTAEETSGAMGTGPQGPGVYADSTTLNIASDNQLPSQAGWRLHLGLVDEDRWPSVGLNFLANPSLIEAWTALGYGARITIDNPPAQMPPDMLDLIVEGHTERWDGIAWRATLNCSPASPYRVGVVGSTTGNTGRVDAANSSVAAAYTSGGVSLSVASPAALWRTGAVNFDIGVGGMRATVTNIAGGSSPQVFTITPGVNGINKNLAVGTKVSLWAPVAVAL